MRGGGSVRWREVGGLVCTGQNSTRDVEPAGGVERREPVLVWQVNLDVLMV